MFSLQASSQTLKSLVVVAETIILDADHATTSNFNRWHFVLAAGLIDNTAETVKCAQHAAKRLTSTLGGHKITQLVIAELCHLLWHTNAHVIACNEAGGGAGGDLPASGYIVRSPAVVSINVTFRRLKFHDLTKQGLRILLHRWLRLNFQKYSYR